MKKITHWLLFGALLGTSQLAYAEGAYFGISLINGSGDLDTTIGNVTVTEDHDTKGAPFHFGAVFSDGNRFQFSVGSIDFEFDGGTDEVSGFDLDYIWVWEEESVNPYLTAGLGFYDYEDTADLFVSNEDLSGIAFNFGGGALFNLNENFEFDISYRIKNISWQDVKVGSSTVETNSSLGNLRFGLNLKF